MFTAMNFTIINLKKSATQLVTFQACTQPTARTRSTMHNTKSPIHVKPTNIFEFAILRNTFRDRITMTVN